MVVQTFTEWAYVTTSLGDLAAALSNQEPCWHMRVPDGSPAIWAENVGAQGAGEPADARPTNAGCCQEVLAGLVLGTR